MTLCDLQPMRVGTKWPEKDNHIHTNILTSYNSKSASHEKDAKLERLQQQVAKLQQPFIKSQNDNKELKWRSIQKDYSEEAESSF